MKLSELIDSIDILESHNHKELDIKNIACNSKKVENGDLFVCIKGYQTDGHKYIGDALANGAVAVIVEDFQKELELPQYVVANARVALAGLADRYYEHPSQSLKVIGITATNGKTTTSFMLNDMLEKNNIKTGLIGTVLVKFGNYSESSYLTTPESNDLHRLFREMKNQDVSHVCMEVSSSALELSRVGNVDFDIVSLNNISREHIDLHGSFEQYYDAKASLIRNAKESQWVVLNNDDDYSRRLADETKGQVITFGIHNENSDFICKNLDVSTGRGRFTLEIKRDIFVDGEKISKGEFLVNLRTPGYHTIYNAMAAIIMGLLCHVPIEVIQESLATFGGVERRFEIIFEDDFVIIDDHFANSGNINATFQTLEKMKFKDLRLIYAIRGSRGVTVIREAAEAIAAWSKKLGYSQVVTCLSKSHVTWKDKVVQEEIDVFNEIMLRENIEVIQFDELDEGIQYGLDNVKSGDVLFLAGCQGMDFGAKVALNLIHELRPELSDDILFAPLKKRVAGV